MLTKKQHQLLLFINQRLEKSGISPSFDEMKEALKLRSKSGVHRLVVGLEERGFLRRLPHRARALEVLKLPGEMSASAGSPKTAADLGANVVQGVFSDRGAHAGKTAKGDTVELPIHGRIAAGTPIEALQDNGRTVEVPASTLGRGEHFVLEVAGDSMIDAGILDGDLAIIRRGDTANTGAIVVALIDDAEATLKRLRIKGASIALEPANAIYETRIFGADRVKIQGRLVGLYRRYR